MYIKKKVAKTKNKELYYNIHPCSALYSTTIVIARNAYNGFALLHI